MISLDDLPSLQRKVERLKAKADKAAGAKDQILRRLRKEFGCKTMKEAKKLLEDLITKENQAAVKYSKEKKAFEKKHAKVLKEI